ncbi:PREDICTED: G-type lectin S-receptor-like serine/threonine-protein kinase At4g03230 [Nelumbo nucifera]|uniref:G-type lectin S-receptor-like serine/threonine-protein kinase At4g03230 n=1 Tax=Nelumbo nucifera TaxID=4432 RepID=A0A1U8AJ58_NELNU|nr:PREDICTED: G-type lectin S-receptor-like serine/threonine-protein kinase At4g03230 [Nelumbo nucifera]
MNILDFNDIPNFTGSIPYSITKLQNLDTLSIWNTSLSGPIPEFLSQLKNLRGIFELGFFTPGNSTNNRYLGIWYRGVSPQTLVWVANRDRPIPNWNGVFTIFGDGNLQILDEGKVVWSTKVATATTNTTSILLDSGNLILTAGGRGGGGENGNHNPIWQSFVYDERNPSNTFLPRMKLEANQMLRSWTDEYDPAPGAFTFEHHGNGSTVYWRSGSSDGLSFLVIYLLSNYSADAIDYSNGNLLDQLTRKSINPSQVNRSVTKFNYRNTRLRSHKWELLWSLPNDNCNVHKVCGANAVCNVNNTPACEYLPGFRAQSQEDWDSGNHSGGCTRTTANNEPCMLQNLDEL